MYLLWNWVESKTVWHICHDDGNQYGKKHMAEELSMVIANKNTTTFVKEKSTFYGTKKGNDCNNDNDNDNRKKERDHNKIK